MTTLSSSTMKRFGGVFDFLGFLDARAPRIELRIAVLALDLLELVADHLPAAVFVLEERGNLPGALALLGQLLLNHQDFETGEPVQLQLEDRVGLLRIEREALHDLLGRVGLAVRLADDLDDLVERVEDLLEAFEEVNAALQLLELVFETAGHHFQAEVEEVPEHALQVEALRPAHLGVLGGHEARQVDGERGLQRRVLEQVRHHQVVVGAALQFQLDAHIVGRHIPHVDEVRHLAARAPRRRSVRPAAPCSPRRARW